MMMMTSNFKLNEENAKIIGKCLFGEQRTSSIMQLAIGKTV